MIGFGDIYKVVAAMMPLYVALGLGYCSVRWWRIFTPEQCVAINRLVSFFTLPLFTLEFTLHTDPFAWNYLFIAADAVSKLIIMSFLFVWAKCSTNNAAYAWSITHYSLSTLTNSLVVGVPLLNAMYGKWSQDLVVQSSVVQAIVWLTLLLFVLEVRKARSGIASTTSLTVVAPQSDGGSVGEGDKMVVTVDEMKEAAEQRDVAAVSPVTSMVNEEAEAVRRPGFCSLMKVVSIKLAMNPNSYACFVGVIWAIISNRCHVQMPSIIEDSVLIMSKAGTGMAMFSMGLFMALQKKMISCGPGPTVLGMILRFIAGPAAMAVGSLAVGLRRDILRVAIIQAALPQSITSFIFAREYGLHADVLSTAVIFGMLVSLPVLIFYYWILGFLS